MYRLKNVERNIVKLIKDCVLHFTIFYINKEIDMEQLWSPWRSEYIDSFSSPKDNEECFLCTAASPDICDDLLISKGEHCLIIMNKFPYNAGHLLIAPLRHCADLLALDSEEYQEMMNWTKIMTAVIRNVYKPHGFNIGINLGQASGAGVPGHLHMHIVPRWNGDTNFMSTIGDLKVISHSNSTIAKEIRKGVIHVQQYGIDSIIEKGASL
jgi:ATP adenylyltransferase